MYCYYVTASSNVSDTVCRDAYASVRTLGVTGIPTTVTETAVSTTTATVSWQDGTSQCHAMMMGGQEFFYNCTGKRMRLDDF